MKKTDDLGSAMAAADLVDALVRQQHRLAEAQSTLAALALAFADRRVADEVADPPSDPSLPGRCRPGEFVADEVSLALRMPVWEAQRLLARSRRLRGGLPSVWAAGLAGRLDEPRLVRIDRAARLVEDAHVLAMMDESVVEVAAEKTVKQLDGWLERFLATHEPDAYAHRHQVRYRDRKVSVAPAPHGVAYVTGLVSTPDAQLIDSRLDALARACGAADPRTLGQRKADLFADLLLDRVEVRVADGPPGATGGPAPDPVDTVEVEIIDPDTGEYLGTRQQGLDADGAPVVPPPAWERTVIEPRAGIPASIGVVVPLSTLTGDTDRPGRLADRSGCLPADQVRNLAAQPEPVKISV